jgi:hypothetical protein
MEKKIFQEKLNSAVQMMINDYMMLAESIEMDYLNWRSIVLNAFSGAVGSIIGGNMNYKGASSEDLREHFAKEMEYFKNYTIQNHEKILNEVKNDK